MARRKVVRGEGETRKQILEAAIRHFSEASYDEVALRSIAADVGVDVSYVHHSFGSKEALFLEALSAAGNELNLSNVEIDDLPAYFARLMIERRPKSEDEKADPMLLLVRSLTSQKASSALANRLEHFRIEPLRKRLGDTDQFRASMIMSLLIGFSIMQNLLQLPAVTEVEAEQAEAMIAHALKGILSFAKGDQGGTA